MNHSRRRFLALTVVGSAALQAGCIGSFSLSSGLLRFNRSLTSNKFLQWLVFLAFVIIPVYEIALIVDALVFNSIEFWTGKSEARAEVEVEGGHRLELTREGEDLVHVLVMHADGRRIQRTLQRTPDGIRLLDGTRSTLLEVGVGDEGDLTVRGANGESLARFTSAQVEALHQAYETRDARLAEMAQALAEQVPAVTRVCGTA